MIQSGTATDTLVARISELAAATPAQVHALGVAWFEEARMRVLVVDPSPTAPLMANRTAAPVSGHAYGVHVDGALADRPLVLPPAVAMPPAERYVTPNGMTVVLWPHGSTPIVHGRLVVDSGHAHDPMGREGLAALSGASTVLDDSMEFDGRELATQVDVLVQSVAGNLGTAGLELDDTELARTRKQLERPGVAEAVTYEQDLLIALYGAGHPYARLSMTAASTSRITRDVAVAWSRKHVVPANSTLVISGQFDPALVKKHITYRTDQEARGSDSPDIQTPVQGRAGFVRGMVAKATPSVELHIGFVRGRGIDEHHAMRLVLERVLALHLARLRTDQALTYGVQVAYEPKLAGGEWSITASVDATRAAEGASSLLAALTTMRTDPESYREELVLARQQVLESYLFVGSDSGSMADRLAELARFDLDAAAADRLTGAVAAVTLTPFHAFLQRELAADGQVFGAFGNAAPVDAALAAARSPTIVTPPSDDPAPVTPPSDTPALPGDPPAPATP